MKKITITFLFTYMSIIMIYSCNSGSKQTKNDSSTENTKTNVVSQEYEFEKLATITGTVQEIPNTSSTEMKSYVLELDNPIKIISKKTEYDSQSDVMEIQIGFEDEAIDPADYINKKITIIGIINPSQTMHDKRSVVMFDAKLNNTK